MALSEFEIIQQVFQQQKVQRADVILGIGDDGAVTKVPENHGLVLVMDTLIENVHFPDNMRPKDIGYRSLAVNLSDLAAMGAEPAWVTLALSLPDSNESWIKAFASGFFSLAEQYNIQLIGGDLTRGPLTITVQAHGFVPQGQKLVRSGAQVGDLICVTGTLGDAAAGLTSWSETDKSFEYLRQRLARPTPRIEVGLMLRSLASSAIDISDGLLADLNHILNASHVGASLRVEHLPLSLALCEKYDQLESRDMALSGGDDYELCFTIAPENRHLLDQLSEYTQVAEIGVIEAERGLRCLLSNGSHYVPVESGYQHF